VDGILGAYPGHMLPHIEREKEKEKEREKLERKEKLEKKLERERFKKLKKKLGPWKKKKPWTGILRVSGVDVFLPTYFLSLFFTTRWNPTRLVNLPAHALSFLTSRAFLTTYFNTYFYRTLCESEKY
jgi:hypothetical protein